MTLLNKGLKDKTYIVLGSCSGGVRDVNRGTSYFEELVGAIWKEGALKVGGEAYTGSTAITTQGTYLTLDPQLDTVFQQVAYENIIATNEFELDQAVRLLSRLMAMKWTTFELMAAAVTEATTTTFQALFNHNHNLRKTANAVQYVRLV